MAELETFEAESRELLFRRRPRRPAASPRRSRSAAARLTATAADARAADRDRDRASARPSASATRPRRRSERPDRRRAAATHAITAEQREVFGVAPLRRPRTATRCPDAAQLASLGCGNPTAVADLHEGETVLDLGSGGGIDVLLSARRVGPTGKAYGLDMTDEMLDLARAQRSARPASRTSSSSRAHRGRPAARRLGRRRHLQLRDQPLRRQAAVFREAARVLRPGGRFAVSRRDRRSRTWTRPRARDMQQWTGCIAGALTARGLRARARAPPGFEDVEIQRDPPRPRARRARRSSARAESA